jgi:hypothetical protein
MKIKPEVAGVLRRTKKQSETDYRFNWAFLFVRIIFISATSKLANTRKM